MKKISLLIFSSSLLVASVSVVGDQPPLVYVNQNIGFNVPGFKYAQSVLPCDIDKNLVEFIVQDGTESGLRMESVATAEKIQNGIVPVLVIDIEKLALGKDFSFGLKTTDNLPKIYVTAGLILGKKLETAKHSCAIATLNELTPSSNVLDLGVNLSMCDATQRCLGDLSKDIIEWVEPLVK